MAVHKLPSAPPPFVNLFRRTGSARGVPEPLWPYRFEVKVPWRDLDAAGHVNNAVYLSYLESARTEAFLRLRQGARVQDLDIILARVAIDYRSPANFGEVLVVTVAPTRVGESSFTLRYDVRETATGRLVAEAESVQVMFDYAANAKKRIPDDVRAKLAG